MRITTLLRGLACILYCGQLTGALPTGESSLDVHEPTLSLQPLGSRASEGSSKGKERQKDAASSSEPVKPPPVKWEQMREAVFWTTVKEPKNSNWDEDTIREIAMDGYTELLKKSEVAGVPQLIAVLWNPKFRRVDLANIPRNGRIIWSMRDRGAKDAKVWWERVKDRKVYEKGQQVRVNVDQHRLYHAEDLAMFRFEQQLDGKVKGPRYPDGAFMVIYGKKFADDTKGIKTPCTGTTNSKGQSIDPGCEKVLGELGIRWYPRD